MKLRDLLVYVLCLLITLSSAPGLAASSVNDSEEALRNMLSDVAETEEFPVFAYGDYDGDGIHEAFALIGKKSADGGYSGSIWFISPYYWGTLQAGMSYLEMGSLGVAAPMLFAAEEWYGGSGSESHVWAVDGSEPVALSGEDFEGISAGDVPNEFYMFPSAFDAMKDGTGHTWKRYFYYLDGLTLREYGAIAISQKDFLLFDGAEEILNEQTAAGAELKDIYYRANDVINLNFSNGSNNSYVTVRINGSAVELWETGSGVYKPANDSDMAVYPTSFIAPAGAQQEETASVPVVVDAKVTMNAVESVNEYGQAVEMLTLAAGDDEGNELGEYVLLNWSDGMLEKGAAVKAKAWSLGNGLYYAESRYMWNGIAVSYILCRTDENGLSVLVHADDPGYSDGTECIYNALTGETLYEGMSFSGDGMIDALNACFAEYEITFSRQKMMLGERGEVEVYSAQLPAEGVFAEADGMNVMEAAADGTSTTTPTPTAKTEIPEEIETPETTKSVSDEAAAFNDWFNSTPQPTAAPTAEPTPVPTSVPTAEPTAVPTVSPTEAPQMQEGKAYAVADVATEIRLGPGVSYEAIGKANAGEALEYMGVGTPDKYGAVWHAVTYAGGIGWVAEDCIHFEGNVEAIPTAEPPAVEVAKDSISNYVGEYAVEASSYRYSNEIPVYGSCALDRNLNTAWNTNQRISEEWIKISVKDGKDYQFGGLRIANGYWKNNNVYTENSKPRTIDIYCDTTYVATAELENIKSYQTVWFDEPVVGSSIKIVIRNGYSGNDFADCCITEIDLIGPEGKTLNSKTLDDWGDAVRRAELKVLGGGRIAKGDRSMEVLGLQLLLKDGFGVLDGTADGSFGSGTQAAVEVLAGMMRAELTDCEPMASGVVDASFWRNMLKYMDLIG